MNYMGPTSLYDHQNYFLSATGLNKIAAPGSDLLHESTETQYYRTGEVAEVVHIRNWVQHRNDGPAVVSYYKSGQLQKEQWFQYGAHSRGDNTLPSMIEYYETGEVQKERWHNARGALHRDNDLPAIVAYYEDGTVQLEKWFSNGIDSRKTGPSHIDYDVAGRREYEEWDSLNHRFRTNTRYRRGHVYQMSWYDGRECVDTIRVDDFKGGECYSDYL